MNSENPKSRPEIDMEGLRSRIKSALSAQRMTVQNLSDAAGIPKSTLDGFLEDVISDYRPVCIRKDGIELVDDVGGIYGFCDMLRTICCKSIAVS